jgi:hypothetical protein
MTISQLLPKNALEVWQGQSVTLELAVTVPDDDNPNVQLPFDLTGSTIYYTAKKYAEDSETVIHKNSNTPADVAITDARSGLAEVYLIGSDLTIDPGDYEQDAWVELVDGKRFPVVVESILRVRRSVTRF